MIINPVVVDGIIFHINDERIVAELQPILYDLILYLSENPVLLMVGGASIFSMKSYEIGRNRIGCVVRHDGP